MECSSAQSSFSISRLSCLSICRLSVTSGLLTWSSLTFRQGRYDAAMRDYKKGKSLLESRPGQLLPISAAKDTAVAEQQQKRILEKVWAKVEKTMTELRTALLNQLKNPTRSVEEQEKTLE